jgi:hypothetical protein
MGLDLGKSVIKFKIKIRRGISNLQILYRTTNSYKDKKL